MSFGVIELLPDALTSTFDSSSPFAACRICGATFQSTYDRNIYDSSSIALSYAERRKWTYEHAREHSIEEHLELEDSGKLVTEAARHRLSRLGIRV